MMAQVSLPQIEIDNLVKLFSQGRIQKVIDKIQVLNSDYPNIPLLFNMLGVCHKKLGNIALATKMVDNAISLNPNYAEAHYNLGVILKQDGKLNNAVASYKRAIALLPNYADAYNNLGNILRGLGKLEAAKKSFEAALIINPNYSEAKHLLNGLTGHTSKAPPRE